MTDSAEEIAKASYVAFAARNREAHEKLLAEEYTFTSPYDNCIDRDTFYKRCWPNGEKIEAFDFVLSAVSGDKVVITYEGITSGGKRFRNTEIQTVRNGQITQTEVYFGWNIPHEAAKGSWVTSSQG